MQSENQEFAESYVSMQEKQATLSSLYAASYELHASLELPAVLNSLQEIIINLLGSESFGIYLFGGSSDQIIVFVILIAVLIIRPGGLLGKVPLISSEPLTGTFLGRGRPFRIPKWVWPVAFVIGGIVVPLVSND